MLDWIVNEKGIFPHIPVWDRSKRDDGTFSREDFTFDKGRNTGRLNQMMPSFTSIR